MFREERINSLPYKILEVPKNPREGTLGYRKIWGTPKDKKQKISPTKGEEVRIREEIRRRQRSPTEPTSPTVSREEYLCWTPPVAPSWGDLSHQANEMQKGEVTLGTEDISERRHREGGKRQIPEIILDYSIGNFEKPLPPEIEDNPLVRRGLNPASTPENCYTEHTHNLTSRKKR